jgi:lipoate-protein ligase A
MLGRNQIAEAEIDIGYANRNNIQIVRRSSGGGTIFTDPGTLLYTMILPYNKTLYPLEIAREQVAGKVIAALNNIGIPAQLEGRNDILVEGKKVSGLAQYIRGGKICTHGSLLYDADLEALSRVLRVDDEKIRSKALRSIRSRVTNIREYMSAPCSTAEFRDMLKRQLFCELQFQEYELTEKDLAQIDLIFQKQYGSQSWTFTMSPKFSFYNSRRFHGGKVDVYLDVVNGTVLCCSIRGDFLGVIEIRALEQLFENRLFRHQDFSEALQDVSLQPYLGNITREEFLSCIFD